MNTLLSNAREMNILLLCINLCINWVHKNTHIHVHVAREREQRWRDLPGTAIWVFAHFQACYSHIMCCRVSDTRYKYITIITACELSYVILFIVNLSPGMNALLKIN